MVQKGASAVLALLLCCIPNVVVGFLANPSVGSKTCNTKQLVSSKQQKQQRRQRPRYDCVSLHAEAKDSASRREFLRNAVVGTSAVVTAASCNVENLVANAAATPQAGALSLPPLGLGAWAWGDSLFWGYNSKNDNDLKEVFDYAVSKDLAFFDTAELYGFGRSETLLGQLRKEYTSASNSNSNSKIQIATKFAAFPTRTKPSDVLNACRESVKRLGGDPIDLYQIHFPNAWSNEEYWDGLAMAYEQGLVKAVGVSNYGVDALRACHKFLQDRGIPLATNQIQLSLLYQYPLENGLMDTCKELGVQVLSYSPLALGFLTGKYSKDNLPKGPRQALGKKLLEAPEYLQLLETMKTIARNHGDNVPVSQVALNWARAKGSIPIPGARNLRQAQQNCETLNWNLSSEEIALLDACPKVTGFVAPDASPFAKKDINTGLKMFDS